MADALIIIMLAGNFQIRQFALPWCEQHISRSVVDDAGAAGAFEAVACIKTIEKGIIAPTINYETPDPECDLDYTPNKAREMDVKVALSDNLGFGGHNGVVAFKKVE